MLKKILPLAVLVAGLVLFFATGAHTYVSFQAIQENRDFLLQTVEAYGVLAALGYILIYAVATAFSLPVGALLTVVGGFMFGLWAGTLIVALGATLGAVALFVAAKTAFGDMLRAKAGPWLKKMEAGFKEDAVSYLLVLRLVPLFPFFVVNLVPAFFGVSLRLFTATTFFGILPGTFVYVSVGNGLGAIFDRGETPDLGIIFNAEVLTPIVGLALLSLVPVIYKRLRKRGGVANNNAAS
ncbi:MAG: TVP38/TMEM64 family protein [Alphaproteobacteria bacterium]|nr:TVP38/TMEM64 family protein [Alphaproteobacteria bacterium]